MAHKDAPRERSKPVTPNKVIEFAKENKVQVIDLRFMDLPGVWQHVSIPVRELAKSLFEGGKGFDGSSIRGFQAIQESDMLLVPDPDSAFIDPFLEVPTLALICDVRDPASGQRYHRDPRYIAQRAEQYLNKTGIGDKIYFGPELEFFILDEVRFDFNQHSGYYFVDSAEAAWNTGREESPHNLGYKVRYKEGYFPVPPMDTFQDLRTEMMLNLEKIGIQTEVHHHEVATAGQAEIDMRFDTLVKMADNVCKYKYVLKNTAHKRGKTVTFMPKPIFQDNGSGMHCHQSIWKEGKNTFYEPGGYADLSENALYYIGGLIHHTPALLAFCAPTTNSYRRLTPGYEAPVNLAYSNRNRSAIIRIPAYFSDEKAKRLEYRVPDPSCNPYLAFAAMLMAGLDGIRKKIHPGDPMDMDLYDLPPEIAATIKKTPGSLDESLAALEKDNEFLLAGDVFSEDLIQVYIDFKRKKEVDAIRLRPHPYEFALYFDI
ncbi:MAG: type I glutamate--ammonia ligase [Deinococcus sp.]|nr:type I glutamate--ammonia ligase [Deinococcus sp.]